MTKHDKKTEDNFWVYKFLRGDKHPLVVCSSIPAWKQVMYLPYFIHFIMTELRNFLNMQRITMLANIDRQKY